jgi:hypothetical protein
MTQEEIITALEQAFYAESGSMTIPTRLSQLVDEHADDDDEHREFIHFFEWVLRLSEEHDG